MRNEKVLLGAMWAAGVEHEMRMTARRKAVRALDLVGAGAELVAGWCYSKADVLRARVHVATIQHDDELGAVER